jgi:hypothetical protein
MSAGHWAAWGLGLILALGCGGSREDVAVPAEDLARWKARTEEVRGLRFAREVELVRIAPERIPELIEREISRDFSPEQAHAYADAYAALGLLPAGLDLFPLLVELYGDQLAGLYEPRQERLYVREGQLPSGYSAEVVAVHELVHALQHQHFPATIAAQFGIRHNDDLSTMLAVVTEGDASLAAFALSPRHGRSPEQLQPVRDAMMQEIDDPAGAYARAPRPLRLRLVVPYADGLLLAARVHAQGGNAALDEWLKNPPLSTLVLVDPQAPQRPVDFIRLPLRWLEDELAAKQCRIGHHDVVGPLMIQALFQEREAPDAAQVAASWSGDRLLHAVCGELSELFWLTRWNTAQDAARFAASYLEVAPAIARIAGLSAVPRVSFSDRTVLVRTKVFDQLGAPLEAKLEVRSYADFSAWVAGGCFPEERCQVLEPSLRQ